MSRRIVSSIVLSSLLLMATSLLVLFSPANAMEDHAIPVIIERLASLPAQLGNYSGKYAGQFTNQSLNASGSVVLDVSITSSAVSGYINFTNNPNSGSLCGAGNFSGTRNGDTIQFSFTSGDSDPGCTWANGLVFNVSGVLSGNQIVNGVYTVSDGENGVFSAMQTTPYTGRFTTLNNRVGSVSIDLASSTTMVAGFINFTNDPGAAALCGAGSFVGTRNVDSIQFSFLSNDPDTGCTFDKGLVFNISGTVSGNQLSASYAIPSISEGGSLSATAPLVDTTAPTAPGNPVATSILQTSVAMNWADNSNNEDGFKVYRYDGTVQDWVVVSTVSANVTSYTVTGLSCNTQYYFNINAYNAYGEVPAPASGWLIVTTGACDSPPPSLYTVSGRIIDGSGNALVGATISDGTRNSMTDSNGNYTISDLPVGNYTLTPSMSGYTFNPTNRSVSISRNVTGQDFVGVNTETRLVDVSISLYSNPTSAQRVAYEDIVRYFADGVFEESNGAHKLRTVTIYPNQGLMGRANIEWIANCWPNAHPSGYGVTGLRVEMCDSFSGVNFLVDHEAGGYVLAHEWGHYFYGLYDEYRNGSTCQASWPSLPCERDTPVQNSIMNSQWNARGGNYSWLNFSASLNNTRNTAQHRVYQTSGWETLSRSPALDPRNGVLTNYPTRLYYPELANVAPQLGQSPRIDLVANHTARSAIQIVWANSSAPLAMSQPMIVANVSALDGVQVRYPEPLRVLTVLQRDHPIAGAVAEGEIIASDGSSQIIALRDDGIAPDTRANDGLYTAIPLYKQDGSHTIRVHFTNNAGMAYEVSDSGALAPPLPGTMPQLPTSSPITDTFDITSELSIQVTNMQADDHGDTSSTASTLVPNSLAMAGQIDRAGDRDVFRITATNTDTLAVRVTDLAWGMQPQVRLLAADGMTELAKVDFSTLGSANYLLLTRTVAAGEMIYVEITHQNSAATQGFYRVSAGALLTSEVSSMNSVYLPMIVR